MATDIPMPKLGLTMEEATIIEWLAPDGALVEADAPIMRIETDKTETEVASPGAGRLRQIGRAGDVFACGVRIGVLLAEGETWAGPATPDAPAARALATGAPAAVAPAGQVAPGSSSAPPVPVPAGGRVVASPYARAVAAERSVPLAAVRGTGPGGRIVAADVVSAAERPAAISASAVLAVAGPAAAGAGVGAVATHAARQLAELLGLDLATVPLDPVEQRITRDSVALHVRRLLHALAPSPTAATVASVPSAPTTKPPSTKPAPLLQQPTSTIRLTGMRGTIAKRMTASLQQMAQLTLTMDADLDAVLADRAARTGAARVPSITDYVLAASARALLRHPAMNAQVTDEGIALLPDVHVGLAVSVEGGLLVPVVRDAAHLDLAGLATETARLAAAARSGTLSPSEYEGGTFSVSALGAFGVDVFTPVINPPNAGILGVGRLRDDVVLRDGAVTTVKRLTLSLTWDHRVLDGVPAAEYCRTVVELLADPSHLD